MALILAVDPDAVQEQALQTLARLLDDHELVTADSCEEGLAAIDCRTPDLLLVPLLLPEADETALLTRLRERSKRRNVRVLTTPLLKSGDASSSSSSSRFGWRRSSDDSEGGDRCEPAAFAQMIREYLVASGDEAKIEEERRKRRDAAVMAAAGAAASWIRARRATWTDAPLAVSRSRSARGGAAASFETVRGEHVAAASEPEMPVVSGLASSLAPVAPAPSRTPAAAAGEYAPIPRALDPDDEWSADQPAADPPPAEPEAPAESRLAKIARWAKPLSARVLRKPTQTTAGVLLLVMGTVGCAYLLKPRGAAPSARVKIETPAEVYASGLGAPPIEVPRKGQLRIESSPVGAQVLIDGKLRGVTPLTLADVAPGKHTVLLQSTAGSVSKQVSVSISKSTVVSETIYPGWVAVLSPFEIAVSEDGRPIRLDDRFQALLPPGPHDLRIEGRSTGFDEIRHVDVTPGDTIRLTVAAPQSRLSVTASAPADVLVDGANVGATPLSNAPIEVGTRDIVVRGAAGERRFTLPVTTRPLTLDVDFSKP